MKTSLALVIVGVGAILGAAAMWLIQNAEVNDAQKKAMAMSVEAQMWQSQYFRLADNRKRSSERTFGNKSVAIAGTGSNMSIDGPSGSGGSSSDADADDERYTYAEPEAATAERRKQTIGVPDDGQRANMLLKLINAEGTATPVDGGKPITFSTTADGSVLHWADEVFPWKEGVNVYGTDPRAPLWVSIIFNAVDEDGDGIKELTAIESRNVRQIHYRVKRTR